VYTCDAPSNAHRTCDTSEHNDSMCCHHVCADLDLAAAVFWVWQGCRGTFIMCVQIWTSQPLFSGCGRAVGGRWKAHGPACSVLGEEEVGCRGR
jgi:hypothetical protein